jgi:Bacterial protein of unknown function (DUF839)
MVRPRRITLALIGATVVAVASVTGSQAAPSPGFITSKVPLIALEAGAPVGSSVKPLISVGDTLPGGYRFEAIPDGLAIHPRGQGRVDVYVNHETSTVPFPFNPAIVATDPAESQNDFVNAEVSRLALQQGSGGVLSAKTVIGSDENFQRFCSNYLATAKEGFDREILFTNEEAQDWVFRTGTAWPGPGFITPGTPGAEQPGVVVAHDPQTGKHATIYGMGRFNHENDVAIPGYDDLVVLSGDDTFSTTPASSQLYMYKAADTDGIWNDEGTLYALSALSTSKNDYFDIQPGDPPVAVEFVPVPSNIAHGKDGAGNELLSTSLGYPAPPAGTPDGPQWVLDQWGNKSVTPTLNNDVFDFIRIEDIAYDKRQDMGKTVYLADSGRATSGAADPLTKSTNGRVWKLVLDPSDPTKGSLSVLIQGDDAATKAPGEIHQPDNLETTANGSLLVQEDPSTNNQFVFPSADPNRTSARIWRYNLATSAMSVVARVATDALNQKNLTDEDSGDLDPPDNPPYAGGAFPVSPGNLGAWETSGIVDASSVFGDGAFLVDVQAHTYWVDTAPGVGYNYKREGGQLLLLKLPGV